MSGDVSSTPTPGRAPFAEASRRTQVRRLRAVARRALVEWGLADADLRLVNHGYNATFGVRLPDGTRHALRLNVNTHKEPPHLAAELAWLAALGRDTDLRVPVPRPTRAGAAYALVHSPDHGRALPAVLFGWLPGRTPGLDLTRAQCRALGAAAAVLHDHASGWRLPEGAALPDMRPVHMNVADRLGGHPLLPPGGPEVVAEATRRVQASFDGLFERTPPLPLHADLHGGNLLWDAGRLGVLDFDDAGMGHPVQDLGIAAYYLRGDSAGPSERERWFLDAYADVRPRPDATEAEFEAVLAGRALLLANDLVQTLNAEFQRMAPAFLHNTVLRLRHWLDTGRFARLPGELPMGA